MEEVEAADFDFFRSALAMAFFLRGGGADDEDEDVRMPSGEGSFRFCNEVLPVPTTTRLSTSIRSSPNADRAPRIRVPVLVALVFLEDEETVAGGDDDDAEVPVP